MNFAFYLLEKRFSYQPIGRVLIPMVLFIFTFMWVGLFASIYLDPHHDGVLFKPALDVVNGKILFKETFTQYGALTTLIQATALQLFGKTILVFKLSAAFFYALSAVVMWLVWKRVFKSWTIFFGFLFWFAFAYFYHTTFLAWSSVYAFFFQSLVVYVCIKWLEDKKKHWLHLAGMCLALTFLCRQPVGVFLALSVMGAFGWFRWKNLINQVEFVIALGHVIACGLLVSTVFVAWLLVSGAFIDWWKQSVLLLLHFGSVADGGLSHGSLFATFFPGIERYPQFLIWSVIPISFIVFMLHLMTKRFSKREKVLHQQSLIFVFAAMASWLQYYPMSDPLHWHWATTPFMVLLPWAMYWIPHQGWLFLNHSFNLKLSQLLVMRLTLISVLAAVSFVLVVQRQAFLRIPQAALAKARTPYITSPYPLALRGLRLEKNQASELLATYFFLSVYLQKNPQATSINLSRDGLFPILSPVHTEFHALWMDWPWVVEAVYPEYTSLKNTYIASHSPLLFLNDRQPLTGYCFFPKFETLDMVIGVPLNSGLPNLHCVPGTE